jgi:N-acetyl-alpha-D-muramate 1-phosphate uridylyltransferase
MIPVAILCGGSGTRMLPDTAHTPKSLLNVAGKPFIDHQLALLHRKGIQEVVLCIGVQGDQIRQYVGDGGHWNLYVRYSEDGPVPLGTGGTLRKALPLLGDDFFVLYGDSYTDVDFNDLFETYLASGDRGLLTIYHNKNALYPSNITFNEGTIWRYDKERQIPTMEYIDYGLSILSRLALSHTDNRPFDLAFVYQRLIHHADMAAYLADKPFFEVGSPEGRRRLESYLTAEQL